VSTEFEHVVINAVDPAAQARWWRQALGWRISYEDADDLDIDAPNDQPPFRLVFVRVPGTKVRQNRLHLDLASRDPAHQQSLVEQLLAAGATRVDVGQPITGPDAVPWVVLGDPEGNEFCVLEPREVYRDTGPLAAVVLPAVDADALAAFWQQATGWERTDQHFPSLRATSGGPFLEFLPGHPALTGLDRLHLDVRPSPGSSQTEEVRRLTALGAETTDIGQGRPSWQVMHDPEGNAFCVLSAPPGP
jgi:catechol 2,3-dioxygenase-like lactoylglutathione lyase family enzyme